LLRSSPKTKAELLTRCEALQGLTFAHLSMHSQLPIPLEARQRKGWLGMAVEKILGASAGNKSLPDFPELDIELKTIPLNQKKQPAESTFLTSISLLTIHQETWMTSCCYAKLKCILWLPVEGCSSIDFYTRRIGRAVLWEPNATQKRILEQDWLELTTLITTGNLEKIDATFGEYLQIRPKGANAKSLCYGINDEGCKILTMPRAFYLRSRFTKTLL